MKKIIFILFTFAIVTLAISSRSMAQTTSSDRDTASPAAGPISTSGNPDNIKEKTFEPPTESQLKAEDSEIVHQHRGEFYLGFGSSKDVGYLYSDGSTNRYLNLGARFWTPAWSPKRKYRGFFEIDYTSINSDEVTDTKFPFSNGKGATVKQFTFVPNLNLYSSAHWNWFLGVGPALIYIEDSDHNNQQTYGSFVWQGGVIYEFNQNWNFGLRTQWTKIAEKVSGQRYFQEFWNTNWFFSYAPDWLNGRR